MKASLHPKSIVESVSFTKLPALDKAIRSIPVNPNRNTSAVTYNKTQKFRRKFNALDPNKKHLNRVHLQFAGPVNGIKNLVLVDSYAELCRFH